MKRKIHLGFLWHMHQPYYRDPVEDTYILPWTRLHAVNAYYSVPRLAQKYGNIRMTFNLVPSLIEQLEDYAAGRAKDLYERYSRLNPGMLDRVARIFILRNFFMANWDTMIRPNSRYNDLLLKRGYTIREGELETAAKNFNEQDFMDLQTWFNLAWIGPIAREEDRDIQELLRKGRFFSEAEKNFVLDYQIDIIRKVLPLYRQISEQGIAEITMSPFYHPILPLLFNTDIAGDAHPGVKLPTGFRHPEDAMSQIKLGMDKFESVIGRKPSGMWPSEGSVSVAVADGAASAGLKWIATDERILMKSLPGVPVREQVLYKPYSIETQSGNIAMFFRDTQLSDLIGFTYGRNTAEAAVDDFISRLGQLADSVPATVDPVMVSVILDGENPWEYYPNCGREFLVRLFERLGVEPWIETVTFSGFLEKNPPQAKIERLSPGSWINGNFDIWIGKREANQAWDSLGKARDLLMKALGASVAGPSVRDEILRNLYRAEGSDWFWWFDDDFSSETEMEFDLLFRKHLSWAFHLLNLAAPDFLTQPIKSSQKAAPVTQPADLISPTIDGEVTHFYEWANAGTFAIDESGAAMYDSQRYLGEIKYGFDMETFYLRLDPLPEMHLEENIGSVLRFQVHFLAGDKILRFDWSPSGPPLKQFTVVQRSGVGEQIEMKQFDSIRTKKIIELAVPFSSLGLKPGGEGRMVICICRNGLELKRYPQHGFIPFRVPDETFELQTWSV